MWSKLTIDMTNLSAKKEPLDEALAGLGGRGMIAQYLMQNVPPTCDPLGPENHLIFCLGTFAGTNFTTAHRLSVGSKSPLTRGIKESNVGGYIGALLAEQGIKLISLQGQAPSEGLWLLHIDANGSATLLDALEYKETSNYELREKLENRFGKAIATAQIGPAGERGYAGASIMVSEFGGGHPSRAAARGGLGAVMGAKGIKAIVVEKPFAKYQPEFADKEKFKEAVGAVNQFIAKEAQKDPFHNIGTVSTIEATGRNGVLPVDNFSGKLFPDYGKVGANAFMTNLMSRGGKNKQACQPGCVVQCSNTYPDASGEYLTSGLEYETIAMFGPNCHNADLDAIAEMDRFCDDFGIDTIETGGALAVAMDAGKIPWGDTDKMMALLLEMTKGTDFGVILANGTESVGKHLGAERIPTVKHQAMAGYDPRNTKGTGITYATSPMGADHTAGLTMGRAFDDAGRAAQAYASNKLQVAMCIADSMMCIFAFANAVPMLPQLGEMYDAMYGTSGGFPGLGMMGVKTLLTERGYNQMAGLTQEDDRLPAFFYEDRSEATGSKFDIDDYELEALFDF